MSVYQVVGKHRYRDHPPGSTFEADLHPPSEARAIARGDISLLRRCTTTLEPGSWTLPAGWPDQDHSKKE